MKIEVKCSNCQSVLRVGSEHAGKQLRCPTCGTLCNIPHSIESPVDRTEEIRPSAPRATERGDPDPDYKPPVYIGPHSAPLNPEEPVYRPSPPPAYHGPPLSPRDENLGRSFLMFGLGVASAFVCGCLAIFIAPALFGKGMEFARNSNDQNANVAFFLNAAGMFIWAVVLLLLVTSFLFG